MKPSECIPNGEEIQRLLQNQQLSARRLDQLAQCAPGTVERALRGHSIESAELDRIAGVLEVAPRSVGALETPKDAQRPFEGRVFISYCAGDIDFVESDLLPFLDQHRVVTWIAPRDIQSERDWQNAPTRALGACDWFLVVLSPSALTSAHVREEFARARALKPEAAVLPVVIKKCDPEQLAALTRLPVLDLSEHLRDGLARVVETLRARHDELPLAEVLPVVPAETDSSDPRRPEAEPQGAHWPTPLAMSSSWPACLVWVHPPGPDLGRRYDVGHEPLGLGRDPGCAIYLPDKLVSYRHAQVFRLADGYALVDEGSTNGTFLNGACLKSLQFLSDRDLVRIGETQFRVLIQHDLNAAHVKVLRKLADTDPGTECNTRSSWEELVRRELDRASDHERPLAVVLMRVDQLRTVTQQFGASAADIVLRTVIRRIEGRIKSYDAIALWAWDELAIARFETSVEGAERFAEQVRREIARIPNKERPFPNAITVSAGVAGTFGRWIHFDDLLATVGQRLREAVRKGGNQVVSDS